MKAICITQPFETEIRDIPMPVPEAGEALLRILYCGICGADVASFTGNQPFTTYPRIPGHEFSAQIVSIPENDRGLKPGDLVTCNPYFNCGTCYACRKGRVNACMDNQTMGVQRDGAFCEYIRMPLERIIPGGGLNARQLALIEPFAISRHAVSRGDIHDRAVTIGAALEGVLTLVEDGPRAILVLSIFEVGGLEWEVAEVLSHIAVSHDAIFWSIFAGPILLVEAEELWTFELGVVEFANAVAGVIWGDAEFV